jgi:hypothetical protein
MIARAVAVCLFLGLQLSAQTPRTVWATPVDPATATTGSADEESLLLLQLLGRAPLLPVGIRSFSATTLDTLVSFERPDLARSRFRIARPELGLILNANRAFGENDGVVWAGRGLTAVASGGGIGRMGPFSFAFRPVAFWTQNLAFQPPLGEVASNTNFQDPSHPGVIDLPYRFGNKWYGRIDPGESWVQLDTRWIVAGLSTATQQWGPMHVYPLLLGPNAGGFPHVLLGTGLPLNVGIGRLSARTAAGQLDPSAFAPAHPGDPRRFASELVATFSPRGIDGIEVGGGRFFHVRWPSDGFNWDLFKIPFQGVLKDQLAQNGVPNDLADNQLASAFFRVAPPRRGFELYGELLRDDHNFDLNDLVGEPDHESAYGMGFRRAWISSNDSAEVTSLTIEMVNGRVSRFSRLRDEGPMYTHTGIVEGHTERGQLLGSPAVYGGSGYHVDLLRRSINGGWRATLASEYLAQNEEGGTWNGTPVGYYLLGLSRIVNAGGAEYTVGANAQLKWNALAGGNNFGLTFSYRPRMGNGRR